APTHSTPAWRSTHSADIAASIRFTGRAPTPRITASTHVASTTTIERRCGRAACLKARIGKMPLPGVTSNGPRSIDLARQGGWDVFSDSETHQAGRGGRGWASRGYQRAGQRPDPAARQTL